MHVQSCLTLCDPMDCSLPVTLSIGFPRQEYWNGLPSSMPWELPNAGIKLLSLVSPALAGSFFITEPPGMHNSLGWYHLIFLLLIDNSVASGLDFFFFFLLFYSFLVLGSISP